MDGVDRGPYGISALTVAEETLERAGEEVLRTEGGHGVRIGVEQTLGGIAQELIHEPRAGIFKNFSEVFEHTGMGGGREDDREHEQEQNAGQQLRGEAAQVRRSQDRGGFVIHFGASSLTAVTHRSS